MRFEFEEVKRPDVVIKLTADEADKLASMMYFTDTIPTAIAKDRSVIDEDLKEGVAVFMAEIRQNLRDYGKNGVRHFKPYQS